MKVMVDKLYQTVQRLEGRSTGVLTPGNHKYEIVLPRVLGDLITPIPEEILVERQKLILSGLTKGNTRANKKYRQEIIPKELSKVQFDWALGILLSDGTLQANSNNTQHRMKMAQSSKNRSLIDVTFYLLEPYCFNAVGDVKERADGTFYVSFQTIQADALNCFAELLGDPNQPKTPKRCIKKIISNDIEKYLSEVVISAWFCGDGGRRDYGKNEGKAIQFYTQGFDLNSIENLVNALRKRYNWDVSCQFDRTSSKGESLYLIQVEASSFDSFYKTIHPFLLPNFARRLPQLRSDRSRWKSSD